MEVTTLRQVVANHLTNLERLIAETRTFKNIPRYKLHEMQRLLGKIDSSISSPNLNYRIARSRYYLRQWMDGVKDLRIRRIEGYQPYDAFVMRRLGRTFDFIESIGLRYNQVKRDIAELTQVSQGETVQDIQRWGEGLLFAFIVPYYVGSLVVHFLTSQHENVDAWYALKDLLLTPLKMSENQNRLSQDKQTWIIWATVWSAFIYLAIIRIIYHSERSPKIKTILMTLAFFIIPTIELGFCRLVWRYLGF